MNSKKQRLTGKYNNSMNDMDFLMSLDPDIREYFDDSRLVNNKSSKKKKRSKKANFTIGDQVEINGTYGTIIYGPYDSGNGKDTYEIECENGSMVTAEDNGEKIKKYVAPVEDQDNDDLI